MLRQIARSQTIATCRQAEESLKNSAIWKNPCHEKLVKYLENYWLNIKKVGHTKSKSLNYNVLVWTEKEVRTSAVDTPY